MEVACAPDDALEKAIQYTSKRWSKLTRFLQHPFLPLDNNPAERALRGPVVGRKTIRVQIGTRTIVAAIFYSLFETAKLNGVDPGSHHVRVCLEARERGTRLPAPHELALSR